MSIEFLLTSLIIVASPGTGVLYTLSAGLSRGARAAIIAAFACTLGIIPHMAAAITGLAAVLHTSAVAFETLKYLGVAYLLYMAWNTLKETGGLNIDETEPQRERVGNEWKQITARHVAKGADRLDLRVQGASAFRKQDLLWVDDVRLKRSTTNTCTWE